MNKFDLEMKVIVNALTKLLRRADRERTGPIWAALLAIEGSLREQGVALCFSPAGITWERKAGVVGLSHGQCERNVGRANVPREQTPDSSDSIPGAGRPPTTDEFLGSGGVERSQAPAGITWEREVGLDSVFKSVGDPNVGPVGNPVGQKSVSEGTLPGAVQAPTTPEFLGDEKWPSYIGHVNTNYGATCAEPFNVPGTTIRFKDLD